MKNMANNNDPGVQRKRRPDKKIVILGDMNVGKSALIRRFLEGAFIENTPASIGVCCSSKEWNDSLIAIWDTAGQETFKRLVPTYVKNANAAILCYAMNDKTSFEAIETRHSLLLENNVAENCVVIVVATKSDLITTEADREISYEEASSKALKYNDKYSSLPQNASLGDPYFETSSKDNNNVNAVFEYVFNILAPPSSGSKNPSRNDNASRSSRASSFRSSYRSLDDSSRRLDSTSGKEQDDDEEKAIFKCCCCC